MQWLNGEKKTKDNKENGKIKFEDVGAILTDFVK